MQDLALQQGVAFFTQYANRVVGSANRPEESPRESASHVAPNIVVDPASIELKRRKRGAKSDRLDVTILFAMLIRC